MKHTERIKGEIISKQGSEKSERKQAMIKWSKAGRASLCVTARHTHLPTSES